MSFIIPDFTISAIDEGFQPEDADTRKLYKEVAAFAMQGQPIVIFGPAGSGKEFLARHYYKSYVKSQVYLQLKKNWYLKYQELRNQYSKFYSDKNLEILLSSLKPGIFQSINSASIYPNLAEIIFFGEEENSVTGAITKPGLLELIKCGILYIEELGELSPDLQAKFLRAFSPEISCGCRKSGRMNYSLKDLIIITATNQPQDKVRKDFYYRMGIQVVLKGIDERPDDIRKSVPYFIGKAMDKRKDLPAICRMFGVKFRSGDEPPVLSGNSTVNKFARDLSGLVSDEIMGRKWPGNFRALRTVLEASVLRIEKPKNLSSFSEEFRKNLYQYVQQYGVDPSITSLHAEESSKGNVVYPSKYPDMDRRILERINTRNRFRIMSEMEKKVLAVFLSSKHESGFNRKELEDRYGQYTSIKHRSEAHLRGKIKKLLELNILEKTGEGKSTRYKLTDSFLEQVRKEDYFALTDVDSNWADRTDEIDKLASMLSTAGRIYIKAAAGYGKSAFITMFCHAKKHVFNNYYYELGQDGIRKLFEDIYKVLQSKQMNPDQKKYLKDPVSAIRPLLYQIFKEKNGREPVLILDNAHFISEADHIATLENISRKWKGIILILVGDNIDNTLQADFTEFRIGPWGKQA